MSAFVIPLLRNINAFENIRSAVCAAQEYKRELCEKPAVCDRTAASTIVL